MSIILTPSYERLSNRDKNMLGRAVEIAKTSTCKQKHGAVLYRAGKVLSVGVNATRNEHPTMEISPNDYTLHAEMAAMRSQIHVGLGATIYVARVNRKGDPVYSAPCSNCLGILISDGIKRVVFTA